MFAIIKNKEITCILGYEPKKGEMPFDEIIQGDFNSNKFYKFENGEVIEFIPIAPIKTEEEIKQEKISEFKKLEIEAIKKVEEYKNTELLPDGVLKTMKLEKVLSEKSEIEKRFNDFIENLEIEYGEGVLNELI